jgi:hypothetical protein
MHITRFQVCNYKSFIESGEITLGPGFNVICGQNNAGKTALLEAFDAGIGANPHRSLTTVPTPQSAPAPTSWIDVSFYLSHTELLEILRERGAQTYLLPWRVGVTQDNRQIPELAESFLRRAAFEFSLRRDLGGAWRANSVPSFGGYTAADNSFAKFSYNIDGTISQCSSVGGAGADIGVALAPSFQDRIYRFSAERVGLGTYNFGTASRLLPNASNLAQVLDVLQSNTPKFRYFNELVREVLPQVYQVSVAPKENNLVEIRVWTADPSAQRLDLTVPLAQCGTGIGQVLAILYVAVFSTSSQVLIIDEPQSFLHPGAVRKLVQVLKSYSKHQYIVATHSPTVISAADATSITMCRLAQGVSTLAPIDPNDAKDLRSYLSEVGARLADVFGADNVLWVEGRTEEVCFPIILEKIGKKRLGGVAILSVSNTGELQTRDAERVFDLYNRLSERNSLLPPAVAFILDSECRTQGEKADLRHRSRDLLKFLPRRMYENYLLNPAAIASVANGIERFRAVPVNRAEVEALIQEMEQQGLHSCPSSAHLASAGWKISANATKVLERIFNQLSESRVAFDKVSHAVLLTEWLIENAPEDLKEVADLIASCL